MFLQCPLSSLKIFILFSFVLLSNGLKKKKWTSPDTFFDDDDDDFWKHTSLGSTWSIGKGKDTISKWGINEKKDDINIADTVEQMVNSRKKWMEFSVKDKVNLFNKDVKKQSSGKKSPVKIVKIMPDATNQNSDNSPLMTVVRMVDPPSNKVDPHIHKISPVNSATNNQNSNQKPIMTVVRMVDPPNRSLDPHIHRTSSVQTPQTIKIKPQSNSASESSQSKNVETSWSDSGKRTNQTDVKLPVRVVKMLDSSKHKNQTNVKQPVRVVKVVDQVQTVDQSNVKPKVAVVKVLDNSKDGLKGTEGVTLLEVLDPSNVKNKLKSAQAQNVSERQKEIPEALGSRSRGASGRSGLPQRSIYRTNRENRRVRHSWD